MGEDRERHESTFGLAMAVSTLLTLAALAASPAPAPDAEAIVRETVRTLASERAGLTAFHHHFDYDEYGPAHHKTLVEDSGYLRKDGALVEVRLYSHVANGAAASSADLAKLQATLDKQLPADDYVLPLDDAALADYRFSVANCDECASTTIAIAFTSVKRDPDHGDGVVEIDAAT